MYRVLLVLASVWFLGGCDSLQCRAEWELYEACMVEWRECQNTTQDCIDVAEQAATLLEECRNGGYERTEI